MRFLLLLLCLATPAWAQDTPRRMVDASEDCPVDLPDWATPSERYAWDRICKGQIADMSFATGANDGAGCDALDENAKWPDERILSPRFIKLVTARKPYTDVPAQRAVRIRCARIDDRLDLSREILPQTLWLYGSRLPSGVAMRDTQVLGDLTFDQSVVSTDLTLHRLSVTDDLYFRNGRFPATGLMGARIGGQLSAVGSTFTGLFNADGLEVGGSMFLRDSAEFAGLDWSVAKIGGHAQFFGGTFDGRIDLTGLTAPELSFYQPRGGRLTWGADAELILRNATVDALQARLPKPWEREDGTPLPVDPVGFTYSRLGGLGSTDGYDLSSIEGDFVEQVTAGPFLNVQGDGYVPQPYMQLESVLRDMGADRAADQVALKRHERRMAWLWEQGDYLRWGAERLWSELTGFGIRPFRVLWWFGALVLFGTFVANISHRFRDRPTIDSFWYSLENALPLIQPSEDHTDVTHRRVWIDSFFHFQKLAGFVLATVLVGALTLLGG